MCVRLPNIHERKDLKPYFDIRLVLKVWQLFLINTLGVISHYKTQNKVMTDGLNTSQYFLQLGKAKHYFIKLYWLDSRETTDPAVYRRKSLEILHLSSSKSLITSLANHLLRNN